MLKPMAGAYPDTRVYSSLIALESTPGGNIQKAREYVVAGLERPTRPREYETALIYAGKLLLDDNEALRALKLAMELLAVPVVDNLEGHTFPFATKLRLLYKYRSLGDVVNVLYARTYNMNSNDSRQLFKIRDDVRGFQASLGKQIMKMGVKHGEEMYTLYSPGSIDEM